MKTLDILRTASSNLTRSKLRTFLTIIAIFIGSLTMTLTNGIGAGVSSYIDKQLGNIGAEDMLIVRQQQDNSGASNDEPKKYDPKQASAATGSGIPIKVLTDEDIKKIESTEGIKSVTPQIAVAPEYIYGKGDKYKLNISTYIEGTNLDLVAGNKIDADSTEYQLTIPVSYVKPLGFTDDNSAVGQTVMFGAKSPAGQVQEVSAKIVGVQQKTLIGNSGIMVSQSLIEGLRDIQVAGLPDTFKEQYIAAVARFDVNAGEDALQQTKDQLREKGYQAMTIDDTIGILRDVINAITTVLNIFAGIALLAASFGIINTLLMAVQERTKEIGLMKAMGMSSSKIFLLFSTEAVLLGFWGSLLGVVAGYGIGQVANRIASEGILKDLPGFDLLAFPVTSMVLIIVIIMAVAFIAGTMPARRAARQNPIDALRYE